MKKILLLAILISFFSVAAWGNPQDSVPSQNKEAIADSLKNLKNEVGNLNKRINDFGDFITSIQNLAQILGGLAVVFAFIQGVQAFMAAKGERKYETLLLRQEESSRKLLDSVVQNIDQTTKFIESYTNLMEIQKDAASIREELERFKRQEGERHQTILDHQKEKNAKAMRLIKTVFKANFGASFFNNFDRGKFHGFFVEMSPHLVSLESGDEMEMNWNADVYFLIGLNHFLDGQSRDAEKYLEKAISKADGFIKNPPENTGILFPERDLLAEHGGVDGWNKMLHSKCAFYSGVNHYRLGRFTLATKEFEKAIQYAPKEREPQFLLYQSRYWDRAFDHLPAAMQEMASLSKMIESDGQKDEKTKKMLLARLYKKIGDFYLPSEKDDRYVAEKDLKKALEWYEKAYNLVQEVNGDLQNIPQGHTQFVPMVYFALGKALKSAGKSKPKSPESLFKETETLCEQVIPDIQNPETRYILYYTLAYCQHQLGRHREAGFSIANALVELDRFCSNPNYYGYSPINNIMLPSHELKNELNAFKQELFKRA